MKHFFLSMIAAAVLTTAVTQAQEIHDRKENQQKRIANGVANGSLSPKETAHLETKEARLNKEIRTDRKANGGNFTNNKRNR